MTPKQQAIKKAYGDKYDTFKDEMDEDGWVVYDTKHKHHPEWHGNEEFLDWYCPDFDYDKFRPKSLRGLENNRGWISVDDRLPEESGVLHQWVSLKDGSIHFAKWQILLDNWEIPGIGIPSSGSVTHWQPVVKPEAPIY